MAAHRHLHWAATAILVAALLTHAAATAQATSCADVDLVVARGTSEPGYLGAAIGDPLAAGLTDTLPMTLSTYRVNYPADLADPLSVGKGSQDLVTHLLDQAARCPTQRFILAGYSQGAVVVHTTLGTPPTGLIPAAALLPDELTDRIAVILLFGDPLRLAAIHPPERFGDRVGSWCTDGDPICQPGGTQPPAHISYGEPVAAAISFTTGTLGR